MEPYLAELETLFVALSDHTRLRIVQMIGNGEASVGMLVAQLGESQPKVSRHLAYMRNAGLVATRRDGKWIYYHLDISGSEERRQMIASLAGVLNRNITVSAYVPDQAETPSPDDPGRPAELDVFLL
jgi:ArsR family transcriptional regulator, arsenate/arsenite/antimonite-responsive transcriptional repressor